MRGTPKTLAEAINQGIEATAHEYIESGKASTGAMEKVLKDYIAQKIGAAVLEYPENEVMLMELFNKLTRK